MAHRPGPVDPETGEAASAPSRLRGEVIGGPGVEEDVAPETIAPDAEPGGRGGAVASERRMGELVGEQVRLLADGGRSAGHARADGYPSPHMPRHEGHVTSLAAAADVSSSKSCSQAVQR